MCLDKAIENYSAFVSANPSASSKELISYLYEKVMKDKSSESLSTKVGFCVFVATMFTDKIATDLEISAKKDVLSVLVGKGDNDIELIDKKAKHRCLIGAFEWFCATKYPELFKKFPIIMLNLLNLRIIPEESFGLWSRDSNYKTRGAGSFTLQSELISDDQLDHLRRISALFIELITQSSDEEDDDDPTE